MPICKAQTLVVPMGNADRTIPASGYDDVVALGHSLTGVSCGLFGAMSLPESQLPAVFFQVGHGCFQFATPVSLTGVGIENNLSFHRQPSGGIGPRGLRFQLIFTR
jgi:hypothetical protein